MRAQYVDSVSRSDIARVLVALLVLQLFPNRQYHDADAGVSLNSHEMTPKFRPSGGFCKSLEELVETVHRRQELVLVAEMVLAELAGGVAQRPQQLGDGGILRPQAQVRARKPYLAQAGAKDA